MKYGLRSVLCVVFLIAHAMAWGSSGHDTDQLAPEVFGACEFSILETMHLKLGKGSGYSESPFCSIGLAFSGTLFIEARASVFVVRTEKYEANREGKGVGFVEDADSRWTFQGTDLLLDSKMLKTSFTEEHIGDETLLVGHQLIKGNIAQGGPITVPGIRILRITPEYVVSVELNFEPLHYEKQTKGYKQLREAVSQELVEIVKSVQITPGVSGPTARSATTP
ncbi:hypothetical protein ACLIKD_10220 [Azonexus sp. IMCC34842]|uniref:hypothetical protein n=1 Tax=Azonexus sp. IMCC34842 TaxID=3420950 RepID=UPI003D13981E